MKRPIYVIGHKNPDTDSIVSAIAYANFKKELGFDAVAGRLGGVSSETEYLLKKFGFDEPINLFSAKCILKEINLDNAYLIDKSLTIKEALDLIVGGINRSIFISDKEKHLEGIVSVDDLTDLWTSSEDKMAEMLSTASFDDIVKTLKADVIYRDEHFIINGKLDFYPTYETKIHKGAIVVVNNSPEIQRHCLDEKISLLVIVGESWIDDVTLKKAKDNHVSVISTRLSPLAVSQLIFQSPSVENIMTPKEKVISFSTRDTVDEASVKMSKSRFHAYPVLNHKGQIVGSIGRYHLLNYEKKRFILVDHNEVSQSINDIDYGEVIEVVDHHRFGGLETINPVTITTMVVGATCTIVAMKYLDSKVELTKNMAGLLLGGIIADTMSFKSPTTTQIDIDMAHRLEEISGCTIKELSEGLIASSESILNKRNIDIMYSDFKEFTIHGLKLGLSQTQVKSFEEFEKIKEKLSEYIDEVCTTQKYDLLLVMFTIPNGSGSYFLYSGNKKALVEEAFEGIMDENNYAPEVVSRKKQVLPRIISVLERNK